MERSREEKREREREKSTCTCIMYRCMSIEKGRDWGGGEDS